MLGLKAAGLCLHQNWGLPGAQKPVSVASSICKRPGMALLLLTWLCSAHEHLVPVLWLLCERNLPVSISHPGVQHGQTEDA